MTVRTSLALVTPALAAANNGNWQTAARWARLLAPQARVDVLGQWRVGDQALMIALHARRSAASIAAWRAAHPARPLVVVLTGTDLYRDIATDADALRSLALADRLVVLNALGARALPPEWRAKTRLVLQSCSARQTVAKTTRHLRALMVGHLRDEKDPLTYLSAARALSARADIRLDHIGGALDPALAAAARRAQAACPAYRWLGALPHGATRRRIQSAHLLVHPSRMEGGAHVVIEALRSGTPVLASCIDGNLGLLGEDYDGYFPPGDSAALVALLQQARDDPAMLAHLGRQAAARAPLFTPEAEAAALAALLAELLPTP